MKKLFVFFSFALLLAAPLAAQAQSAGGACNSQQLGTTLMSSDKTSILACLKEGAGYSWKTMTATKPVCRVCIQFVDKGGTSGLGAWQCTPYGGGMSAFGFDSNAYDPDGARVSFDCL